MVCLGMGGRRHGDGPDGMDMRGLSSYKNKGDDNTIERVSLTL